MLPIFQYEDFVRKVKRKQKEKGVIVFGILICDYRQQSCREYILNYLNRFHKLAGKNMDFYLPGYVEEYQSYSDENTIKIANKKYYFVPEIYEEFLDNLSDDFDIPFPYNPKLILMEYDGGHFKKSKKVIIELDSSEKKKKKVGELFEKIFVIAQNKVGLKKMMGELGKNRIRDNFGDMLIELIDNKYLTKAKEMYEIYKLK